MTRQFLNQVILAGALLLPALASAASVVVVAPSVYVFGRKDHIANRFLGKCSVLSGASLMSPDQEEGSEAADECYQKAAGQAQAQRASYWSRIVFTGKGQPPREAGDV